MNTKTASQVAPFSPGELKIEKKTYWLKLIIHQKHFDKRIFESRITQISDLFQMPHLKPCLSVVFTDFSLNARKLIMQTNNQCNWNKNQSFHCYQCVWLRKIAER